MSTNATLLTFAALDAALGALLSKASGLPIEEGLTKFRADFETFRSQPVVPAYKDLTRDLDEAKVVITDLKSQLAAALEIKADKSAKPVIAIGNAKYVVHHGAHPHSVQDIVNNPELAKDILKIAGQNAITKL